MYVAKKNTNRSKILKNNEVRKPILLSKKSYTDRGGNSDTILELEFFCLVNNTARSTNKNLHTSNQAASIELRLSKNSLFYYKTSGKISASSKFISDNIKKNKPEPGVRKVRGSYKSYETNSDKPLNKDLSTPGNRRYSNQLNLEQSNYIVNSIPGHKNKNTKSILSDTIKIGSISLVNAEMINSQGKKLVITNQVQVNNNLNQTNALNSFSFRNAYMSLIEMGIDPAQLFQGPYKKKSFGYQKRGIFEKIKSITRDQKFVKDVVPVIDNAFLKIRGSKETEIKYENELIDQTQSYVSTKVNISLKKLQSLGENINVLMFCKNKQGVYLEASDYTISLKDIKDQLVPKGIEYEVNSSRLNSGVSILSLNNNNLGVVDVVVHAKKTKRNSPSEYNVFNKYDTVTLKKESRKVLRDGSLDNSNKNFPKNFKRSENIIYRTTVNLRGKSYSNFKTCSDKGKFKQENTPHCTIFTKTSRTKNSIEVYVQNISNNVVAVRPKKYRYKGSAKSEKLPLISKLDSGFPKELNTFTKVKGSLTSIRFEDFDVYRSKKYMYVVECMMKNGEVKDAAAFFIHDFSERDGTVLINNVKVETNQPNITSTDATPLTSNSINRKVTLTFNIKKIETEIDKILKNLFGGLFDIFKDDLSNIKDLQGLVYSVEVVRINKMTGENTTVGKVTADESGNCVFVDNENPAFSDTCYMLSPRVSPTSSLISSVNETIEKMGKKTIFDSINYVDAANKRKYKNRDKEIHTTVGNKYSRRNSFLKGLIETPNFVLNQSNFDIFLNSKTGDIEYVDVPAGNTSFDKNISVKTDSVKEVILAKSTLNPEESKNIMTKKYYDVSFTITNDFFVDFYIIFIKESGNVYLDGVMHSTDSFLQENKYSYIVEHTGSFGKVEYYIVPVFKDGMISSPKLVAAQLINS